MKYFAPLMLVAAGMRFFASARRLSREKPVARYVAFIGSILMLAAGGVLMAFMVMQETY